MFDDSMWIKQRKIRLSRVLLRMVALANFAVAGVHFVVAVLILECAQAI